MIDEKDLPGCKAMDYVVLCLCTVLRYEVFGEFVFCPDSLRNVVRLIGIISGGKCKLIGMMA